MLRILDYERYIAKIYKPSSSVKVVLSRTTSIHTYVLIAIVLGALGLHAIPVNQIFASTSADLQQQHLQPHPRVRPHQPRQQLLEDHLRQPPPLVTPHRQPQHQWQRMNQ